MKGYKTVIFNVIMGGLVFWQTMTGESVDTASVSDALMSLEGALVTLWTVGSVILRKMTNTSIFKKE